MDVVTRWNSTLARLKNFLEQTPAIMALASITDDSWSKTAMTKIKNCVYNFEEQAIVERVVVLLKPFEIATAIVCAEKAPTMNKVLPIDVKLSLAVAEDPTDPPVITSIKFLNFRIYTENSVADVYTLFFLTPLSRVMRNCHFFAYTKRRFSKPAF